MAYPHLYTDNQGFCARFWMPCVDKPQERCTWDIEVVVPRFAEDILEARARASADDPGRFSQEGLETMVVSSGDLVEHVLLPDNPSMKLYRYSLDVPTAASNIHIAVGPFELYEVAQGPLPDPQPVRDTDPADDDDIEDEDIDADVEVVPIVSKCLVFHLPGLREGVKQTATEFFEKYIGASFPYTTYKIVFIPDPYSPTMSGAGMTFIRQDEWLTVGIVNYMTGLLMKKIFGNNEDKFRLRKLKDMHRHFSSEDEWSSARSELIALKSPLVLYMLDRRMGTGMLQRVIQKIFVTAISGDLQQGLSTQYWLKICRKVSEKFDLRQFADQWIFASGCPKFHIKYQFNRKKMMVEVYFRQENTNAGGIGACRKFTGPFMIRVHEPRGTTYDTQISVDEIEKQHDILYHTKYKRAGQKLKKLKKLAGEMAGGNDDDDADGADILAEETTSKGPDLDQFDRRSLDWIRFDPGNDWVCVKEFPQLRSMWIDQLTRDVDVVAQYEAIVALGNIMSDVSTAALSGVMQDSRFFYRLRMECAFSLAKSGLEEADGGGLLRLMKIFTDLYCYYPAEGSSTSIPRPNKFDNLPEYYLKEVVVSRVPLTCRKLILELLKYNDNSDNELSDNYYLSSLINSLGNAFLPSIRRSDASKMAANRLPRIEDDYDGLIEHFDAIESVAFDEDDEVPGNEDDAADDEKAIFREAVAEVERYLMLDRLIASYHNSITVSCLEVLIKWMFAGLMPVDIFLFERYARYGQFLHIRIVAIDGLILLTRFLVPNITKHLLHIIESDPSPIVRYHTAKSLCSFAVILSSHNNSKDSTPFAKKNDFEWSEIKQKLNENVEIKQRVWKLLNGTVDLRIQRHLLKLCEYIYDPVAEALPKQRIVIKMPTLISGFNEQSVTYAAEAEMEVDDKKKDALSPATQTAPPQVVEMMDVVDDVTVPNRLKISVTATEDLTTEQVEPYIPAVTLTPVTLPTRPPASLPLAPLTSASVPPAPVSPAPPLPVKLRPSVPPPRPPVAAPPITAPPVTETLPAVKLSVVNAGAAPPAIKLSAGNPASPVVKISTIQPVPASPTVKLYTVQPQAASPIVKIPPVQPRAASPTVKASAVPPLAASPNVKIAAVKPEAASVDQAAKEISMPPEDYKACRKLIKKILAQPGVDWFKMPVDPVALNLPNYFDIVKKPMDLSTLKAKLKAGRYKTVDDFASKARLIFRNAMKYNLVHTQVHQDAVKLLDYVDREIRDLRQTSTAPSVPPPVLLSAPSAVIDTPMVAGQSRAHTQADPTPPPAKKLKLEPPLEKVEINEVLPVKLDNLTMGAMKVNRRMEKNTTEWRKCMRVLKNMQKDRFAALFLKPVDPIALGIPQYTEIVKSPMDLSTIQKKLEAGLYDSPSAFKADVDLMLNNCFIFNRPDDWVYAQGKGLEGFFNSEWANVGFLGASAAGSPSVQKELSVTTLLQRLRGHPDALIFLGPVDGKVYTDYYTRIAKPMDLQTMQLKADRGEYPTLADFEDDFRTMINNCFTYNVKGSFGYKAGISLEKYFRSLKKSK
ncbi:hypothetical protein HK101_006326 [Irineochytrium annulatum]|nr:hypothetical protein HK101_006326 [Irineochytrium annulatum]